MVRVTGTVAVVWLLALAACASLASAAPLAMTFSEARANVGASQLSDDPLFAAPEVAPLAAQIDPASGSISGGVLQVPQFSTFITDPVNTNVTVDFKIGIVSGSFTQSTGALTLSGEAGGTLTAEGKECVVATEPPVLTLTTAGSDGGTSPRSGTPFSAGLTGAGAIAGQWTDMSAEPVSPGDTSVCNVVEEHIEGPGGVWLYQEGDKVPPSAPQLKSTDPASPGKSGRPRIIGAAEAGSAVRLYAGRGCGGAPVASAGAADLSSPGIAVKVAKGATAAFSATATDAAGNTSPCSAPISYTHTKPCIVPKLAGMSLARAKAALKPAGCKLGKVHRPKRHRGEGRRALVVISTNPGVGATPANGKVHLKLGPKA